MNEIFDNLKKLLFLGMAVAIGIAAYVAWRGFDALRPVAAQHQTP
jgi:hypothetical protein